MDKLTVLNSPGETLSRERATRVRVILMDVDGVLTDGKLYYLPGADDRVFETKGFNSLDGLGIHMAHDAGLRTGVISGASSPATAERARRLKMTYVYQGLLAKEAPYEEIVKDAAVAEDQVAYIGDDLTDICLMRRAGFAVAVANARPEVKAAAHYVTSARGGEGAVREAIEYILKAQRLWQAVVDKYRLEG